MKRLLDEGGSSFERDLLSALSDERPSPELLARMQQGLGIASGATTAAAAATFGWAKLAFAGLAAAGLAVGAAVVLRHPAEPAPPTIAPSLKPVPAKVEAPALQPGPEPVSVTDLAVVPEEAQEPAAPSRPRPAASVTVDLKEEIRLLDQARAAVRGGQGSEALAVLAKYNRRYPRGQFRQEAQVLRVEALEQSGQKKAAAELGKQFVAAHPESPHVERVERVTGQ